MTAGETLNNSEKIHTHKYTAGVRFFFCCPKTTNSKKYSGYLIGKVQIQVNSVYNLLGKRRGNDKSRHDWYKIFVRCNLQETTNKKSEICVRYTVTFNVSAELWSVFLHRARTVHPDPDFLQCTRVPGET